MSCFSPLDAWRADSGAILFSDRGSGRYLQLPCGQCIGCRLERSRQWAMRCVHESQMHSENCFVTLTYDDDHFDPSLNYRDFQLFMKRLRKRIGRCRFYMCGEYGEQLLRPHFHACLFGVSFSDRVHWKNLSSGSSLYRSKVLESLWPFGFSSIGDVTFESAAYVARYVLKKVTGPSSVAHYERVDGMSGEVISVIPEFTHMSLKPGIGADWIRKFRTDVYRGDGDAYVVVNGMKVKPPRYYDRWLESVDSFEFDDMSYVRYKKCLLRRDDNTPARLAVRAEVTGARLRFKRRTLE